MRDDIFQGTFLSGMPFNIRPVPALLLFTGLNAVLVSTITPVYDFVCFLPYWERRVCSVYLLALILFCNQIEYVCKIKFSSLRVVVTSTELSHIWLNFICTGHLPLIQQTSLEKGCEYGKTSNGLVKPSITDMLLGVIPVYCEQTQTKMRCLWNFLQYLHWWEKVLSRKE